MAGASNVHSPRGSSGSPIARLSHYMPHLMNSARNNYFKGSEATCNIDPGIKLISGVVPFDVSGIEKAHVSKPEELANFLRAVGETLRTITPTPVELSDFNSLANLYMARFEGVLKGTSMAGIAVLGFPVHIGKRKGTLPVLIDPVGFRVKRTGMYADIYAQAQWWGMEVDWPESEKKVTLTFPRGLADKAVEDLLVKCSKMSSRIQLTNTRNKRTAVIEDMVPPKHFLEERANNSLIIPMALGARCKDELKIKATGPASTEEIIRVAEFFTQPAPEYQLP